ncbi:MAG: phenylalanine--tRNA ligase subunit beta [Phycisphaerales bacterium]|nr:phenylalanine--tRNA ligase subunit beta [Phycisphaerales bacterium]
MPVINMPIDDLLALVNRGGDSVVSADNVSAKLHDMGIEVDEITLTTMYKCGVCGKVVERTEAQGAALNCIACGVDFREKKDSASTIGETHVARLDMLAVRPDIFDVGGMARYMRGFVGAQTGLIEYPVDPPTYRLNVDPQLGRDESFRPSIACAVLRGLRLDDHGIKFLMNLQEDLHWALGRDRKLASIGMYDLDKLGGDVFAYRAVAPDGIRFTPLGFSPNDPGSNMTPGEILKNHKTGEKYARLLQGMTAYPLLQDGQGTVLSMPPIINSESTRVTLDTTQCFVDVTGLAQRTVDRALNIIVTSIREVMPQVRIESVKIAGIEGELTTPNLAPGRMALDVAEARDTIGAALSAAGVRELLERMGHGIDTSSDDTTLQVRVPAWRNDIMHPIDLIEDIAVAFGYENLTAELLPTFSVGAPRQVEELSAIARRVFTGLGFHQVMTLTLTSEPAAFEKWRVEPDPATVRIENPISVEQTIARVGLLPGILETMAINRQYDLPQKLFEVGDCCFVDADAETGARERRHCAAAMIGTHIGYADIRAVMDAFAHELGLSVEMRPIEHASYIRGRVAAVFNSGRRIGTMGELHPAVLENYSLKHAVAAMEVELPVA